MADSKPTTSTDREKARKRAWQEAWRLGHPEEEKAKKRAYYEANKHRLKAKSKAYHEANKSQINAQTKASRQANKDLMKARRKAYYEANKDALNTASRIYHAKNKDRVNARQMEQFRLRKYGVSPSQFEEMIRACRGKCPCCHVPFSEILNERPCIDHSHATGKVRGVLCRQCNFLIGHAFDNPSILRACARYLTSHDASQEGSGEVDSECQ
jgi:hypothetical protein